MALLLNEIYGLPLVGVRSDCWYGHAGRIGSRGVRFSGRPVLGESHPQRPATRLHAVTTTPGDNTPAEQPDHHRTPAEEIEWIGAEVEARPKVMFWGTVAVAVVLAIALIVVIYLALS